MGEDLTLFIFEHIGAFQALQGGLGFFIAERRGSLIIGFGGS
jgi:hypothetical protein